MAWPREPDLAQIEKENRKNGKRDHSRSERARKRRLINVRLKFEFKTEKPLIKWLSFADIECQIRNRHFTIHYLFSRAGNSAKGQRGLTVTLNGPSVPPLKRIIPANAIIAPLSVHSSGRA